MKYRLYPINVVALIAFTILVGCGGGGDSSNNTPPANFNPEGYWEGSFTEEGYGTFEVKYLAYDGEMIGLSSDAGVLYRGNYSMSGSDLTATVSAYETNGGYIGSSDITGTVSEKDSFQGSFTTLYEPSGETTNGTMTLSYNDQFEETPSLSYLEGSWASARGTVTIDGSGNLSGSTIPNHCPFGGTISIIDPSINLYWVKMKVTTSCDDLNGIGNFDGYQTLLDPNTFIIWLSNQYYSFTDEMHRQP